MSNQEGGITLGQLFSVVKKSFKRAIVYVLVSVIVVAAVLLTVQAFTGIKTYSSTVSFATANKNSLSLMNAKKTSMVNKALSDGNFSLDISNDVVKSVSVTAIVPEDLESTEDYVATAFQITLKPSSNLKLTPAEYTTIVDNISKQYVNAFSKTTLPTISFNYNVDSELSGGEYLQVAVGLSNLISSYSDEISAYTASNTAIKNLTETETGKTVNVINSELSSVITSLDNLNNTIIAKKIEDKDGGLTNYLTLAKANADADVQKYTAMLTEAQTAFEKYSTTLANLQNTENGATYITYDSSLYNELWEQIKTTSVKLANATGLSEKLGSYTTNLGANTCSQTDKDNTKTKLNELSAKTKASIDDYNKIADAYNENQYLSSEASIVNPAHKAVDNFISMKIILIALVAVALIAYLVAYGKTYSDMKKNNSFAS